MLKSRSTRSRCRSFRRAVVEKCAATAGLRSRLARMALALMCAPISSKSALGSPRAAASGRFSRIHSASHVTCHLCTSNAKMISSMRYACGPSAPAASPKTAARCWGLMRMGASAAREVMVMPPPGTASGLRSASDASAWWPNLRKAPARLPKTASFCVTTCASMNASTSLGSFAASPRSFSPRNALNSASPPPTSRSVPPRSTPTSCSWRAAAQSEKSSARAVPKSSSCAAKYSATRVVAGPSRRSIFALQPGPRPSALLVKRPRSLQVLLMFWGVGSDLSNY
mmetsp:Transcript_64182/g.203044  ORF Transcript_64182/g.203044 Transcript_64182/m.203044 type:complete len:284 (+) Transcript_64182:147-998(+)